MSAFLLASLAFALAPPKETSTMPAKMPIIAMTTSSSINVKPLCLVWCIVLKDQDTIPTFHLFIIIYYGHAAMLAGRATIYPAPFSDAANTLPSDNLE